MDNPGDIVSATKMFVYDFVGKHVCFLGKIYVSATMFTEMRKQENINGQRNVSGTMCPSLSRT